MDPEKGGLPLDGPRCLDQALPLGFVSPALLEIGQEPCRALHAQQIDQVEAGLAHLAGELLGPMEERRREVVLVRRVPVLAVAQVPLDDRLRVGIAEDVVDQPCQERGEAADPDGEEEPAGPQHPARFAEGPDAIGALGQVVERAQQQDGVHGRVRFLEPARVSHAQAGHGRLGLERRGLSRLLDVERHRVHEMHAISARGEPGCVDAGAAAHVEDGAGRRRQVAQDDLLRARELDQPVGLEQTPGFSPSGVVGLHFRRDWFVHSGIPFQAPPV